MLRWQAVSAQNGAHETTTPFQSACRKVLAPLWGILAGPADLIERALWIRKALGGGMRQAGVLAAAGIHALEHHVSRLKEDHERAQKLSLGLLQTWLPSNRPETIMVYVDVKDGPSAQAKLEELGVRCLHVSDTALRLVTHMQVDDVSRWLWARSNRSQKP